MPETGLSEDEWYRLSLEQQVQVLSRHTQAFALGYFRCAILHNTGVDSYTDDVKTRAEWIEEQNPPEPQEEPKRGIWPW